ncbi:MAG: Biotin transporter BioY [Chloroflexi bacterium]|nr:Biotin transporter BioY [Chloroflexota bacterium]
MTFFSSTKSKSLTREIALVFIASFLIALGAQINIPLPFSPVPVTAQTLAVLLTGAFLGSRLGSYAVILYISEGLMGLPVFAGLKGGLSALLGPTGGYLVGFVLAAYLVGWLVERGWNKSILSTFFVLVLGNLAIYLLGLPWLAVYVGPRAAFSAGFFPFIGGDLLKILFVTGILAMEPRSE